jgi:hypothetical protein
VTNLAPLILAYEITLAFVARLAWQDLRRHGARRAGYVFAAVAIAIVALTPLTWLPLSRWQPWPTLLLWAPAFVAIFLPGLVVKFTGGPFDHWQLARAIQEIYVRSIDIARVGEFSSDDKVWLKDRSRKLEHFRSLETNEFVNLYQSSISDRIAPSDQRAFRERAQKRDTRIRELADELWPDRHDGFWARVLDLPGDSKRLV